MILPDNMIRPLRDNIEPFVEENIQPASLDISLGDKFLVEKHRNRVIDVSKDNIEYLPVEVDNYPLEPGDFVLGVTKEFINVPDNLTVMLAGKSTLARMGLQIHITAGWVDPGYRGKLTLEIVNNSSNILQLHPGMLIGQLVFLEMKKKPDQVYKGKYQDSMDVVGARKEKKKFKKTIITMHDNQSAANDGGFDRDVGSDCDSGLCPVR
jgi:dCTP deaminase